MNWIVIGKDDIDVVPGGLNRYVFGLVRALKVRGDDVRLYVSGPSNNPLVTQGATGGILSRILAFLVMGFRTGRKPAVLNIHFALYGAPFLIGTLLARSFGKFASNKTNAMVLIYHYHGPWSEESRVASGVRGIRVLIKHQFERFCLNQADRVVTLSNVFADDVALRFGVDPQRIRTLAPGIDSEWFSSMAMDLSPTDALEIVCVRRLTPRMGHVKLLNALEDLNFAVDQTKVNLTIVGSGTEEDVISAWIREHDRADEVFMAGSVSDDNLKEIMRKSAASVVPTLELEGFGLVVLESMAMGIPVLTTGQGGLSEAMGPWADTPLVFRIDESADLHTALQTAMSLAASPVDRQKLRNHAQQYSWAAVVLELERLAGVAVL